MEDSTLIVLILGIGGIAAAIISIWTLVANIKKSFRSAIYEVLDLRLRENNEDIDKKFQRQREDMEKYFTRELSSLDNKIDKLASDVRAENEKNRAARELTNDALKESYKQDIRRIYYKLRETGELTDHDKAYVDKIFPLYKAIGGNSDIQAKYTEMCEVYGRRTQEKFDELYKKRKPVREKKELIEIEKG